MHRIHYFFRVYLYVWISARAKHEFFVDRKRLWDHLIDDIRYIPKCYMLLVAGNFNTPLNEAKPYICTPDKKFDKAPQNDRFDL